MVKLKSKAFLLLGALTMSLLFVSCNEKGEWKSNIHELEYSINYDPGADSDSKEPTAELALVDQPIEFTDLSLGLTERLWTFEDATPSQSSASVVEVVFNKRGTKNCNLTVWYDNGTSESKDFTVEVSSNLDGTFTISPITPKGCIKLGEPTKFDLEVKGEPTSIEWSFPGGSPATSTEQSPTVTFDHKGDITVSVTLKRADDNASKTISQKIHVGPYPMLRTMSEYDTDSWAGDAGSSIGSWIVWTPNGNIFDKGVVVRGNIGAYGTSHCIQVKFNGTDAWWQFFPRDMWVSNAKLPKGHKYEFTFWAKSDQPTDFFVVLINALSGWMNDGVVHAEASTGWSAYYPDIPYTEEQAGESWFLEQYNLDINSDWKEFRWEFEVDKDKNGNPVPGGDICLNTYPYFQFYGPATNIYLDQIEINMLEED